MFCHLLSSLLRLQYLKKKTLAREKHLFLPKLEFVITKKIKGMCAFFFFCARSCEKENIQCKLRILKDMEWYIFHSQNFLNEYIYHSIVLTPTCRPFFLISEMYFQWFWIECSILYTLYCIQWITLYICIGNLFWWGMHCIFIDFVRIIGIVSNRPFSYMPLESYFGFMEMKQSITLG